MAVSLGLDKPMGFFSNIVKSVTSVAKTVVSAPVKAITRTLDVVATTFNHPIQVAQAVVSPNKTVSQVVQTHFEQPLKKQLTETVIATAGYASLALGAASIVAKGIAATASSLIPATLKGKVVAAVAAPVIAGIVIQEPGATLDTITKTPGALANVGANIAQVATDPSIENIKSLVTENPVIVGGAAAIAAVLAAKAIVPSLVGINQSAAIREQTEAINSVGQPTIANTGQPFNIINQLPPAPSVVAPLGEAPGGTTPKKKKKKKKKKAKKKTRRSKKKKKTTKKRKTIKRRKHK